MIWIGLGIIIIMIIIASHFHISDFIFACIIISAGIMAIVGIATHYNTKPCDASDFNVCDSTEVYDIKDFSVTEVDSNKDNNTSNTYSYTYKGNNKTDNITSNSETTIILVKSSDKESYTKLTVKAKDVFSWGTFTTNTYKLYTFS